MKIYNTLTQQKEEFQPLDPPNVKMYVCGITPYDETHLGHGRAYVTFDVIKRYLEDSGYKVQYIQNVTDIDDKIIQKAKNKSQNISEVAEEFTKSYFEGMDKLNVRRADDYPKATEHIPEMIKWIEGLINGGYAYALGNDVYYAVEKFAGYGKLSKRKKKDMLAGARVAVNEKKRSPLDFALWKGAKEGEPFWESPWGKGRPGWHIECSVMSSKYLGEQFDIHGGGLDLVFPHHENEIAQSEAGSGKSPWVKYWVHNGFVNVNRQKMSKSLGNFFTLKEIFDKYEPMVVRFFLLSTHYRSPINYSDQELNNAREGFGRIRKLIQDVDFLLKNSGEEAPTIEVEDLEEDIALYNKKFRDAMDDDFNTAGAIAAVFEMIRFFNKTMEDGGVEQECLKLMKGSVIELCGILGLITDNKQLTTPRLRSEQADNESKINALIEERNAARKNKDFARSDKIRDQLKEMGIIIEDTAYGTRWKYSS